MIKRESTYRFARQSGGIGHYAQVTLYVEEIPSTGLSVQIMPTAFAWLKDDYGPDAWEWAVCDEYRRHALFGVAYALQHAAIPLDVAHMTIRVATIQAHPAQSSGEDGRMPPRSPSGKRAMWSRASGHAWKDGTSYSLRATVYRICAYKHAGQRGKRRVDLKDYRAMIGAWPQ